jgi:hypothetical protein
MLSIHQPSYFPWLGLLSKIAKSTKFLLLDEVQLSDNGFQNRNIFLTPQENIKYLTIGFVKKDYLQKRFCDLEFSSPASWQKDHRNALNSYYGRHKYFSQVWKEIEFIFTKNYQYLYQPIAESMEVSMRLLAIDTPVIYQHGLEYDRCEKKSGLIVQLVKASRMQAYLSGIGSKVYLDEANFNEQGIKVHWNLFQHPVYLQQGSTQFHSGLSCLDLLFNLGINNSRQLFWHHVHHE